MPRPLRLQDAGYLHHVISVGNDHQEIFHSPGDFQKYIELLTEARRLYPLKIYNFVLLNNHLHLLVEPTQEGSLSKAMEYVSKGYAKYFNKVYNHVGHVFKGRFKSFIIQGELYFFRCSRYIDNNPVKALIVSDPKDYPWSGYAKLAHGGGCAMELDMHELYLELGKTEQERQISYRALVHNIQSEELDLLNKRTCILGDDAFKQKIR